MKHDDTDGVPTQTDNDQTYSLDTCFRRTHTTVPISQRWRFFLNKILIFFKSFFFFILFEFNWIVWMFNTLFFMLIDYIIYIQINMSVFLLENVL